MPRIEEFCAALDQGKACGVIGLGASALTINMPISLYLDCPSTMYAYRTKIRGQKRPRPV